MKKIVLWAITIFFVLGALGFMPSLGSVLLLVCVVLIVPIDGLRNLFPDIMRTGFVRPALAVVLALAGLSMLPTTPKKGVASQSTMQEQTTSVSQSIRVENAQQSAKDEGQPSLDDIELHAKTAVLEYSNKEVDPLSLVTYDPIEGFSLSTEDHIDLKKLGNQEVHYLGTLGDKQKVARATFEVRDTKAPAIAVAEAAVKVQAGEAYDPRRNVKSVSDSVDGELPYVESEPAKLESDELGRTYEQGWYTVSGDFNADVASKYFMTVEACDNHGNKTTKEFSVEVTAPPEPEPQPQPAPEPQPAPTPEPEPAPEPESAHEITYIANTNTHKFHYPSCSSVKQMKDKNKWEITTTRDDLIAQGYVPCKKCNP